MGDSSLVEAVFGWDQPIIAGNLSGRKNRSLQGHYHSGAPAQQVPDKNPSHYSCATKTVPGSFLLVINRCLVDQKDCRWPLVEDAKVG